MDTQLRQTHAGLLGILSIARIEYSQHPTMQLKQYIRGLLLDIKTVRKVRFDADFRAELMALSESVYKHRS